MRALIAVALVLLLAACPAEVTPPDSGLAGFDPHMEENQRTACEARGGRYAEGGFSGGFVCFEKTIDGNQGCSTARDCEGLCLARSRSCTPVKPLFGCNEVLGVNGARSTVCLN